MSGCRTPLNIIYIQTNLANTDKLQHPEPTLCMFSISIIRKCLRGLIT